MYPCSKTVYILVEILVSHIFPNISRIWLDGSAVIHTGLDHLRFGDWIGSTDRLCVLTLALDLIFWAANWGSSSSEDNVSCDPSFWLVIFQLRQTAVQRPAEQSPGGRRPPPCTGRFWCKPHLDKLFWYPLRFWPPSNIKSPLLFGIAIPFKSDQKSQWYWSSAALEKLALQRRGDTMVKCRHQRSCEESNLLQGSTSMSICSPDVQNPPTIKPNTWSKSWHFNMFEASWNLPTSQPSHANPWVDSFVPSPVWPRSQRKTPPTLWRCPSRALPPSCCKGRSHQILPSYGLWWGTNG